MATTTLVSGSIATLLSTELNSLANNTMCSAGSAYSAGGGYLLAEVELVVTFGTAPVVNSTLDVWFLRAIDGTNLESGSSSIVPPRAPDVSFPLRAVTTSQRVTRRCALPPGTFTPIAYNDQTGQTTAASANTVKILPLSFQQA